MKTHPSSQSSGYRRSSKQRSEGRSPYKSQERSNGVAVAAPPRSLWQKITGFFTGSAAPAKAPSRQSESPAKTNGSRRSESAYSSQDGGGRAERIVRKPESVEVTTPRLYVGNLSFDATENDLTELFRGVGEVVTAEVVSHKQTQRSKGFAFVQMQSVDEAKRAVQELHDKEFLGRKLVVSGAKNTDQRDGRSEPRFAA